MELVTASTLYKKRKWILNLVVYPPEESRGETLLGPLNGSSNFIGRRNGNFIQKRGHRTIEVVFEDGKPKILPPFLFPQSSKSVFRIPPAKSVSRLPTRRLKE